MAKRRCIAVDIYESEEFFCLSDKAKVLYTYFMLRSDDEGVVINPKTAMRLCLADWKTMEELIESGFIVQVEGIYVIRHWHAHNRIQPSKKTDSIYQSELSCLIVNEQKIYEQNGGKNPEKVRPNIIKENINKNNINKGNSSELNPSEEKRSSTLPIPSLGKTLSSASKPVDTMEDVEEFFRKLRLNKDLKNRANTLSNI